MITKSDILKKSSWYEVSPTKISNVQPNEYDYLEYYVTLSINTYTIVFSNQSYTYPLPLSTIDFYNQVGKCRQYELVRASKLEQGNLTSTKRGNKAKTVKKSKRSKKIAKGLVAKAYNNLYAR